MAALRARSARARRRLPRAARSRRHRACPTCALPPPRAPCSLARSLAGFKVSARIHAHMLLPVWRHGQFPAPRSRFLPSLRRSHNFQEHGLKAPSPQRPSEILCVFLGPFLFWGARRCPRLFPPLPRWQPCLLPSRGPGRSCLPEARRRRAAPRSTPPSPAGSPAALPTQVGDPRQITAVAARGSCLPRARGIAAVRRLLVLPDRLAPV